MEVKTDYKQTDAGLLPADWDAGLIEWAVESLEAGASVNSDKDETPDFSSYPCVLKTGAAKEGSLNLAESKKVARRDLSRLKVSLRKDTILISRMNTVELVGESGYVDADYPNLFVPDRMWMATLRATVHPRWFSYVLTWKPVKSRISASATGTSGSMKNISKPSLRAVEIPYPPLEEQCAIATALGDVDGLLSGLERLIAKKRDLKQAAMQQLLTGQTRLPGFHGEWEVKRLGDFGKCLRGVSYKGDSDLSTHDAAYTNRLLRSNNVQNAVIVTDEVQFVNAARVSSHQILQQGDILICMANGSKALVGKAGIFMLADGHEYTFGAFMGCFRTNSAVASPAFVFCLFLTARYRDDINNLLAGSSINNLRPSSIESLEFSAPPLAEQTEIAEVLTEMDGELAGLEQQREKTRALKQAMMQELLTGRTRLVGPRTVTA